MITAFSFCLTIGLAAFKTKDTVWYHCVIVEFSKASKPGSVLSLEIAGTVPDRGVFFNLREKSLSLISLLC